MPDEVVVTGCEYITMSNHARNYLDNNYYVISECPNMDSKLYSKFIDVNEWADIQKYMLNTEIIFREINRNLYGVQL